MEPRETTGDRILSELLGRNNSKAEIHINAGGLGVWVATTACVAMLCVLVVGALWASREFARMDQQMVEAREEIRTTQNYLNAIYIQAPHLKPKEKENARR